MSWSPTTVQPARDLTILVIDLRQSSEFFRLSNETHIRRFLQHFSQFVDDVLARVYSNQRDRFHVVKFTGDGFLVLLDEAVGESPLRLGPARALAVAKILRDRTRELCDTWKTQVDGAVSAEGVGVVSGIVHGQVIYGPIAFPAVRMSDAAGEPVIRAFRFAQKRDIPGHEDSDVILTCETTRTLVDMFNGDAGSGHFPAVKIATDGVQFQQVVFADRTRGTNSAICLHADWARVSSTVAGQERTAESAN